MIIDMSKHAHLLDPVEFAFIVCYCALQEEMKAKGLPMPPEITPKGSGGTLDVSKTDIEFKVNGVELNFEAYIERLAAADKDRIARRASALLEERLGNAADTLQEVMDHAIQQLRDKAGLPTPDRE